MATVTSRDGTTIAYERVGVGPTLVLVGGATSTKRDAAPVAEALAGYFSVFSYDRRGRGESGDTQPYGVEREVEDIEAVITEAGGSSFVFGHSSGAVLALEAAQMLPGKMTKLALYEPPFILDDSRPPVPADNVAHLRELVDSGRRGEAVEYFMTEVVGMPAEVVAQMRNSPVWPGLEALAHTLAYDGMIMGDTVSGRPATIEKWASVAVPTLVLDGGNSPAYMHHSAEALSRILPSAQHRRLPGQEHRAANDVLVPVLVEFFR